MLAVYLKRWDWIAGNVDAIFIGHAPTMAEAVAIGDAYHASNAGGDGEIVVVDDDGRRVDFVHVPAGVIGLDDCPF
jgi:DNA polymerase/3'-5' exonuclease PolX